MLERVERQVLADRLVVATLNAGGNYKPQELPSLEDAAAGFDAWLVEVPTAEQIRHREILEMMGAA